MEDLVHKALMLFLLFAAGLLRNAVKGFPTGAPAGACGDLTPDISQHGAQPQFGQVPYEVDLTPLSDGNNGYEYEPGETYTCK